MKSSRSRLVTCLILFFSIAVGRAGGFDVVVTVDVPQGVAPTAENVKLAPLPAGKRLAVVLYVDWSYRSAKNAVPIAEAFHQAGWRGTFFLAGAKDIKEHAPKLEALGQEVATNLFSGGISAYRDEMFSYSPQDILNAIGPLRSELNSVLGRPVVTQLVRGHGVPYRDRICQMGYLEATHWYRHYVLFGPGSGEANLGGYRKGAIPIVRTGKLDEAAFQQAEKSKARAVILGRGGPTGDYKAFLEKHGRKEDYWYATLGELASAIYLQRKAKVSGVKVEGGKAHVTLALADDFNPLFLRAPISLDMAGKVVSVPAETLTGGPLEAAIALSPGCISLPGRAALKVKLLNRGTEQIETGSLDCRAPAGFDVFIHSPGDVLPLSPGKGRDVDYQLASNDKAGPLSFGFTPCVCRISYQVGGEKRTLLAAAELEVRPALAVDIYPHLGVGLPLKGSQTFMITVANIRAGAGRGNWRNLRPKFAKFILPPEGAVRGKITFPASDAFRVEPREIDLDLAAEGQRKTFYVTVTNTAEARKPYALLPEIRLAQRAEPLLLPFDGAPVYHAAKLGKPALDDKGLLMYASWDDAKIDLPHADRARGRKEAYRGAMGHVTYADGVLGKCASYKTTCLLDPWLNFNEAEGTMMFWLRNDPGQKKLLRGDQAERLLAVGTQHPARNVDTSQLYLGLHARGMLVARMMTIGPTYHELRAPYKKSDQWDHVALTWSCPGKFMRLFVNGELRGELTDDGKTWYHVPVRIWPESYGDFMTPISDDHGTYTSTMRDEFYLYNRPLDAKEIQAHIKQVRAKQQKTQ